MSRVLLVLRKDRGHRETGIRVYSLEREQRVSIKCGSGGGYASSGLVSFLSTVRIGILREVKRRDSGGYAVRIEPQKERESTLVHRLKDKSSYVGAGYISLLRD